jgi:trimethylamine:corrinoid methyltransferase-like protein
MGWLGKIAMLHEDHTCEHMREEHFMPTVADRQPRENWEAFGNKTPGHGATRSPWTRSRTISPSLWKKTS